MPAFGIVQSRPEPRTSSSAAHFDSWYAEPQSGRARRKLSMTILRTPARCAAATTAAVPATWTLAEL